MTDAIADIIGDYRAFAAFHHVDGWAPSSS
jgi:hypothetical protein